jgi:hypothetical protein
MVNKLQIRRASLERSSQNTEKRAQLDIDLAPEVVARPHNEQTTHGSSSTENAIGRGDGRSRNRSISGFSFLGEMEVRIPARLADCAADNRRAITIGLKMEDVRIMDGIFHEQHSPEIQLLQRQ